MESKNQGKGKVYACVRVRAKEEGRSIYACVRVRVEKKELCL